ncbi:WD repeat-containing protein 11-like [Dreissena polymorpha]|uniref:WD repeat-containing protein 11-like n=1 Tax=Dreissena polymorpha TaxID=45954 RepID=UPI0022652C23|nr:WD repeat-containing protein 11-like [Dreissena polymorpha]XP_052227948.1 WD repeat-containing protein 11-like [Dreissena polymorpha]XP_052227949.1 WD repeat-containing protein 11-like [Dreissena polymorpha]XP_052227950.1 WD repeat-containing protein 11-like [Dreissena polymorpha]
MNPCPKVITGHLHQQNKGAFDWGFQGFLAYGCQCYTVIVDPKSLQVIQTVGPQNGFVNYVRWAEEDYHHMFATGSTYTLHVASADTSGTVVIWDVALGRARTVLEDEQSHALILGMEWQKGHTDSHDLLFLLRSPDTLELWDAFSGTRLWQKTFPLNILAFDIDPFDMERLVCLCEAPRVLVCTDVSVIKSPGDSYRSIRLADPNPTVTPSGSERRTSGSSMQRLAARSTSSLSKMASLATNILNVPDPLKRRSSALSDDDSDVMTSCVQVVFSPAHQHLVLLVFPSEIQTLDIEVDIVVSAIRLDKNAALFLKCIPCQNVDVLFCLHDNGSVSLRVKRDRIGSPEHADLFDLTYEPRCHSDSLRLLRHCKVYGFTCQPATERQVSLLLSDGRIILIDVMATDFTISGDSLLPSKITTSLADAIGGRQVMANSINCIQTENKITLGMVMSGLVSGLVSPVTALAMIRSRTVTQRVNELLAVGSDQGTVQLLNVYTGQVVSEYKLFAAPVRGIEVISELHLLAFSYPDPSSYGNRKVRSDIAILNMKSGRSDFLSINKDNRGAIEMARISPARLHLVILYKERTLELWNLRTQQLISDDVIDAELKPTLVTWYNQATTTSSKRTVVDDRGVSREVEERAVLEQLFVASIKPDNSPSLVRFNVSKGATEKPPAIFDLYNMFPMENKLEIQQLIWQGNRLMISFRAGQMYTIDGKTMKSVRSKAIERRGSEVQSIQFAPGHSCSRFILQYKDCFHICELNKDTLICEVLVASPQMSSDLVSVCWAGPDSVAVATEDGCIHLLEVLQKTPKSPAIFDNSEKDDFVHVKTPPVLSKSTSSVAKWNLSDVFSPALMEPKLASLLKFSLQTNIEPFNQDLEKYIVILDRDVVQYIRHPNTRIADRCIEVARLFGDEFDTEFWKLVKFVCLRRTPEVGKLNTDVGGNQSSLGSDEITSIGDMDISFLREKDNCLISAFGDAMPADDFKTYATSKLALHNKRRSDMRVKEICSRRYILLNKVDMAVSVLMETDMDHDRFKNDCLKACLTSCVVQTNTSMSTIKLAATHLIAAGQLYDGIELLCLIDMRMDACKYLISHGKWSDAIWLAKTSLNQQERTLVIKRWAEQLLNTNRMNKALSLLLLEGQYTACLKVLCQQRYYDTAALFLQTLAQHGLLDENHESGQIYQEFSKLLAVTGYKSAVERYSQMGKTSGENSLVDVS